MLSPSNPFREFMALMPDQPLEVGEITTIEGGVAAVTLPGGAVIQARGEGSPGQRVFVMAGAIQGEAPTLTYVSAEG